MYHQAEAPGQSNKEMEEVFMHLYREFKKLENVCIKQREMLIRLTAEKDYNKDLPISMPIQCTDEDNSRQSDILFVRVQEKETRLNAHCSPSTVPKRSTICKVKSADNATAVQFSGSDNRFPPGTAQSTYVDSHCQHGPGNCFCLNKNNMNDTAKVKPTSSQFLKVSDSAVDHGNNSIKYSAVKMMTGPNHLAPNLGGYIHLDELYVSPVHSLHSRSVYSHISPSNSTEPKGPCQVPCTTAHIPGDCAVAHVHGELLMSDTSMNSWVCSFCHAVFPAGAATRGEYLRHITAHIEGD
ncbi:uncharacterized protein LOC122810593 [Protopterus annectens]|uniref:uncharacterized protein LOC122810593 n=1 Tax=Protopterus annectens TaxID=7888 RepID=UPI001CF9B699|nr:uncharacterized protein LOC122810593 [Protopterus annectens]